MDPSLGWIGPYHVERELGRGAMGAVYLARDPQRRAQVAVKVLSEGLEDEVDRARFEREVEALTKVGTHPGVVGIASAGTLPDGRPYLAMDYVEGEDLEQLLKRGLSPEKVVGYTLQVTSALGYAHELGLVHRDIKPSNILIDAAGERALLADFGLARFAGSAGEDRLTMTGEVVGTPAYMAPEQLHPAEYGEPGPWTDVYAVGALLYFALTGRSANGEGSTIMMMANLASGERPAPLSLLLKDDLGRRLGPVVDRALSVEPVDRYPSASALAEALQDALTREPPAESPKSLVAVLVALVIVACLLALGAIGLAVQRSRTRGSPTPTTTPASGSLEGALLAFESGETRRAGVLLGDSPQAPAAAPILIALGKPAAALKAAGPSGTGLDPRDWARAARECGDEEARLRALSRLEPGPAAFWALELGEEVRGDSALDPDWQTLLRAARAKRRGDLISARLDAMRLVEAAGVDSEIREDAAWLLLQVDLGLGRPREAARNWKRWRPKGTLGAARRAAWASFVRAVASEGEIKLAVPELEEAAREAETRGPGLAPTLAAAALNAQAPLAAGRPRSLLALCFGRGERWLALAEHGLDPAGARRSLPLIKMGLASNRAQTSLALARALRLSGDPAAARVALEDAAGGKERTLLEVQFAAQALDPVGLAADLARVRSASFGQAELSAGWAAIANTLGAGGAPQDPRLRLAWGAALAERLESDSSSPAATPGEAQARAELREKTLAALAPLAGDPVPTARARTALAQVSWDLDGSEAAVEQAAEELAARAEDLLGGPVPPRVRLEALRLQGMLGERAAASAYLGISADLPARAWLLLTAADYAPDGNARPSLIGRAARLSQGRLREAQLGQGPPIELARSLLALGEGSVERFASTQDSLERLAQTLFEHPDTTNSILVLLAWNPQSANAEAWEATTSRSWLALALRSLVGDPSRASLRSAVASCGECIRSSREPVAAAHLIRGLCLTRLGRVDELARAELASARAGIPWSQAPWRAELCLTPSSDEALDNLVSRGGLRLQRPTLDSGGLVRFSDEAREDLLRRYTQANQKGGWGPRMAAAILLQRVDDKEFPLKVVQDVLGGLSDSRVRRGAYALALKEMSEEDKRRDETLHRAAAHEALWARPLGGASFGQALALELRDRIPFPRAPLWGGLVTEKGERKLRDVRPGSSERRYWRDCDLLSRRGLERLTVSRTAGFLSPKSLQDPDDLSRALLSAPWDTGLNTDCLEAALDSREWGEAGLALRRLAAFSVIDRPASSLAYQGSKRVLTAALATRSEKKRAAAYGLLASLAREGLRCSRPGSDRSRLRGIQAEVALYRALCTKGAARARYVEEAVAHLAESREVDVRDGRRFFAYWRAARIAILQGKPGEVSLRSAKEQFSDRQASDRRTYLKAVERDPWQARFAEDPAYKAWADDLPGLHQELERKRQRRRRGH